MDLTTFAIIIVCILFVLIFIVGIIAGRSISGTEPESYVLAGRRLSLFVAATSMAATSVCGGYLNGTAEQVYRQGLLWTLAPPGICIGLSIGLILQFNLKKNYKLSMLGGVLYAKAMRSRNYMTMLDPLSERYGHRTVALLFTASFLGDLLWSASVLAALGTTLNVLFGVSFKIAAPIAAILTIIYTFFGQMLAVAYTDVVQMVTILVGLWMGFILLLTDPVLPLFDDNSTVQNGTSSPSWLGEIQPADIPSWIDFLLAMILGSIPWQAYFQRVLSTKTPIHAQFLSVIAGVSALIVAIPPAVIGAAATTVNFTETEFGKQLSDDDIRSILPLSFRYLCANTYASIAGLSAIAAGVFSSMDSAVLGSSSMFTFNIYRPLFRPLASDGELLWIQRISICIVGVIATLLAVFSDSVYAMFTLAADLVYCLMLPQLTAALFFKSGNFFGSSFTFLCSTLCRILAGQPDLGIPEYIPPTFPFRTTIVICALVAIPLVSEIYEKIVGKLKEERSDSQNSSAPLQFNSSSDPTGKLIYSSTSVV